MRSVTTSARSFVDNIFVNARSNASGSARNYAIQVNGSAPNPPGVTSNYNDLYVSGTGGVVGWYNSVDRMTIFNWQSATGLDGASLSTDPQFLDPNGTARPNRDNENRANSPHPNALNGLVDLHVAAGTSPCIARGLTLSGISTDYDGETRPVPPTIGADEPPSQPTPTPGPTVAISGVIAYCVNPNPTFIPGVTLTLTGDTPGSTLSDATGDYAFPSVPNGGNYAVTPTKAGLVPGSSGINTVDVLAVQRHFLNIVVIPPGCRFTAADATVNGTVNTQDVLAVQRFFLGFTSGIGSTGKYQFNPSNRTYMPLNGDQTNQNYDAVIFGDASSPYITP